MGVGRKFTGVQAARDTVHARGVVERSVVRMRQHAERQDGDEAQQVEELDHAESLAEVEDWRQMSGDRGMKRGGEGKGTM